MYSKEVAALLSINCVATLRKQIWTLLFGGEMYLYFKYGCCLMFPFDFRLFECRITSVD